MYSCYKKVISEVEGLFLDEDSLVFETLAIHCKQLEGTSNLDKDDFYIFIFIIYTNI